ncbi:hypothetical protein [Natrinema sp. 74]|uniref:hypothetical protein n=1 Tax=Natrinema sp. 74 TaxID=3384159 RepID=UPI0038D491F3
MADDDGSQTTTDHETIREWAEDKGGQPARVGGTGDGDDGGLLRLDFGDEDEELTEISWDEFFDEFEDSNLALVYEEDSRFSKLVDRDSA